MSEVDQGQALLRGLASGAAVATGGFTVDRDKAREKLRQFQLADPCAWLLEAVRAAIVAGASAIEVATDSDDVHVRFDGTAFTREDLEEIYAALLAKSAPPARQHLAAALNGAMALTPHFVRLTTADSLTLHMRPGQSDQVEQGKAGEPRTHIWLREPFRVGRFVEFFRSLAGTKREILALKKACRFLHVPLQVNGALVSQQEPEHAARADIDTPHCTGAVYLGEHATFGGRIMLLHRGVILEELVHKMMPSDTIAVVEVKGIGRDVSLQSFRRGDDFGSCIDTVLTTSLALVEQGVSREGSAEPRCRAALRAFGKGIIDAELERFEQADDGKDLPSLKRALLRKKGPLRCAPVFIDVNGEPLTMNALCLELHAENKVPIARRAANARSDRLVVLARDDDENKLLKDMLGDRSCDGLEVVKLAEERGRARARLASRRGATTLPSSSWLARIEGAESGVKFQLGLREHTPEVLSTTFFVDGCLVCSKMLRCPLPGLALAIEGVEAGERGFTLNAACDDVRIDAALVRALRLAWSRVPALYHEAMAADLKQGRAVSPVLIEGAMALLAWAGDPERLWRSFLDMIEAAEVGGLAPLPKLLLSGAGAHALVHLPILHRIDGTTTAIADLPRPIPVVPWEVLRCTTPHAIRTTAAVRRALLEHVGPLQVNDELALREHRRFAILDGPVARDPALPHAQRTQEGPLSVVLAPGTTPGLSLHIRMQGRPVTSLTVPDAFHGALVAIVDDADLLPLAGGGVAAEDQQRLSLFSLSKVPALLHDLEDHEAGRELTLSLVRSLFITRAFARAAALVDAAVWLELLALVDSGDSHEVQRRSSELISGEWQNGGAVSGFGASHRAERSTDMKGAVQRRSSELISGEWQNGAAVSGFGASHRAERSTDMKGAVNAALELVLEAGERPTVAALARFAEAAGGAPSPSRASAPNAKTKKATKKKKKKAPAEVAVAASVAKAPVDARSAVMELRLAPFGGRAAFLRAAEVSLAMTTPIAVAAMARVPAIGRLSFRTLGGPIVRLEDMALMGEIRFVVADTPRVDEASDSVVVLRDNERPTLLALLGEERFVNVSKNLRKLSAAHAFEARAVETVQLDGALHPAIIEINEAPRKGGLAIRGQVGLLVERSSTATAAHVRVMRGGRTVLHHDLSESAPCSFSAIIDDPALPMRADFSAPTSTPQLAKLLRLCIKAAETGILACVKSYQEQNDDDSRCIILERLARTHVVPLLEEDRLTLEELRLFDVVARGETAGEAARVSIAEARAAIVRGNLAFVSTPSSARRADKLVLVLPSQKERALVAVAIGAKLIDAGPRFDRTERAQQTRRSLAPLPAVPPDALAVVTRTVGAGVLRAFIPRGFLLDGAALRSVVYGGAEGLLVKQFEFGTPLPAFAAVLESRERIDDTWTTMAIDGVSAHLEDVALALGHALIDAAATASVGGPVLGGTPVAAAVLEGVRLLALSLARSGAGLSPPWLPLRERAMALRLFVVADGARICLQQVLADRPPSLESWLRTVGLVSSALPPTPGVVLPSSTVAPPPPEIVLAQRIAETMALVKLERAAEAELARWPVGCFRGDGQRAVRFDEDGNLVDIEHPLAKAALLNDGDPAAFFMLCAVVFGAVNARLGVVTDDHERAFLERLIEHARSSR